MIKMKHSDVFIWKNMFKIVNICRDLIENTEFFLFSFFLNLFLMLLRKGTILPVSKSVLKLLWIPFTAMVTMGFLCMGNSCGVPLMSPTQC